MAPATNATAAPASAASLPRVAMRNPASPGPRIADTPKQMLSAALPRSHMSRGTISGKIERAPARLSVLVSEPATRRVYRPQTGRWFVAARVTINVRHNRRNAEVEAHQALSPMAVEQCSGDRAQEQPGEDEQEEAQACDARGVIALEREEHEPDRPHLRRRARQQRADQQRAKSRDAQHAPVRGRRRDDRLRSRHVDVSRNGCHDDARREGARNRRSGNHSSSLPTTRPTA